MQIPLFVFLLESKQYVSVTTSFDEMFWKIYISFCTHDTSAILLPLLLFIHERILIFEVNFVKKKNPCLIHFSFDQARSSGFIKPLFHWISGFYINLKWVSMRACAGWGTDGRSPTFPLVLILWNWTARMSAQPLSLLSCIQQVPGWDTDYPDSFSLNLSWKC